MNLNFLKPVLRMAGISDIDIRFDLPNEQVIASFKHQGEPKQEKITFKAISDALADRPETARATQPGHEPPAPG